MHSLIDTHVHFDLDPVVAAAWVNRAQEAGVTRFVAVGGSPELNAAALAVARAFPQQIKLAVGLDRSQAGKDAGCRMRDAGCGTQDAGCGMQDVRCGLNSQPGNEKTACALPASDFTLPADLPLAAIGEVGLDYHCHPETKDAQRNLFAEMLRLAGTHNLPAIIHSREADDDTLRVLDESGSKTRRDAGAVGVAHCFTGGPEFARALLDRGLYLSFSGIVTFRNADLLRGVARLVPEDRILIETDSPFLTPVPLRGQSNEPAFVTHVAKLLASVRNVPLEQLVEQTSANAARLFGAWPRD